MNKKSQYSINIGITSCVCDASQQVYIQRIKTLMLAPEVLNGIMKIHGYKIKIYPHHAPMLQSLITSKIPTDCIMLIIPSNIDKPHDVKLREYIQALEDEKMPYVMCALGGVCGPASGYTTFFRRNSQRCDHYHVSLTNWRHVQKFINKMAKMCKQLKLYHTRNEDGEWVRRLPTHLNTMKIFFKNKNIQCDSNAIDNYKHDHSTAYSRVYNPSRRFDKIYIHIHTPESKPTFVQDMDDILTIYIKQLFNHFSLPNDFRILSILDAGTICDIQYHIKLDFIEITGDLPTGVLKILYYNPDEDDNGIKFENDIRYYIIRNTEHMNIYELKYEVLKSKNCTMSILDRTENSLLIITNDVKGPVITKKNTNGLQF